jgi:ketosteroid isomerase-like protein
LEDWTVNVASEISAALAEGRIVVSLYRSLGRAGMTSFMNAVTVAYRAWDEAFNKRDPAAVAASYLPDAKLLPPTHTVTSGDDEIRKFFAGLFDAGVSEHHLNLIDAGGDGNVVFACANWSAKTNDGNSVGGIATHIFERQADGSLKLKLHTFN